MARKFWFYVRPNILEVIWCEFLAWTISTPFALFAHRRPWWWWVLLIHAILWLAYIAACLKDTEFDRPRS